jgi:hypothetical protein
MPTRKNCAGSLLNAREIIKGMRNMDSKDMMKNGGRGKSPNNYFYIRAHMNNTLQKDLPRGVLNYPPL